MKQHHVYIVQCKDNSFYIGITTNLEQRIYKQSNGLSKNAHTFKRRPLILKELETFTDSKQVINIEKQFKGWCRRKKST
ncbi:GIY-YIG nuclease family protein [Aquimarina pacifica]|uniref:GIY-YIG nuclease family protein n=1 Tax=Aquimarina pacifica TaxID=1296415 RepID=UPI0004AF3719|nr:GIY-YIG nuclease family protein [Aquimarina pacifica]